MPLDLIVDSIDSVPEALRGEYAEKDGKFHLNVNGIEDVSGLKSALKKERETNAARAKSEKALADKVAKWESLGKTDAEIQEMLDKASSAEIEAAKKAGNYDALLADHKKKADEAQKLLTAKYEGEKSALEKEVLAARASERSAIIETRVVSSLTKVKATQEGLDLLSERLGRRIVIETVDGERTVSIMQPDGKTPMAGKGPNGTATIDDLVAEAVKTYPSLFEGSGAGGSGTDARGIRGRDAGGKVMTRKTFDALPPMERSARMKAGWTLVDD